MASKPSREKLVHRCGLAHDRVRLYLHAQFLHIINLALDNGLGQTELRNAVDEHAPGLVKGLEYGHVVALLRKLPGHGKARTVLPRRRPLVSPSTSPSSAW